jgi:hypothetical protein
MVRVLAALLLSAAAGSAGTYFLVTSHRIATASPNLPNTPASPPPTTASVAGADRTAQRSAVYKLAADADASAIAELTREAAAAASSPLSAFRIRVLLTRYAELDPRRAVELGHELRAPAEVLGPLYAEWTVADPARARAALAEVDDPLLATTIGLAMFTALGGDERALREIAAELPPGAERGFLVRAVAALAETTPAKALDHALALVDSGLGGIALQRIATTWARQDVAAALAASDGIAAADSRATFRNAVLREWAQFDLDEVFRYFGALDAESQESLAALGVLREIAQLDPQRTLELVAELPLTVRAGVEQAAIQSLAQRDPSAALRYASRLPPGRQQQLARQSIARAYGKHDPAAALAWARATGVRDNLFAAIAGAAISDPALAFEEIATLPVADRPAAVQRIVSTALGDRGTNVAALAEEMLALDTPVETQFGPGGSFGNLLGFWASRFPTAALEWTISRGERLPPGAFASLAASVARSDVATAERYLAQVPAQARFSWLQGIAQSYAQTDPSAAASWVEQYRADAVYPTAVAHIAQSLARLDAPAAAELLDRVGESGAGDTQALSMAGQSVGRAWARTNALAAAEWARRSASDATRSSALGGVANVWATDDYPAAKSWILRLPAGAARDSALAPLLARSGITGGFDAALLDAFSSDAARQSALQGAVLGTARSNPADARLIAARYVAPEQREQVERSIASIERMQSTGPIFFSSD